MISEAYQQHIVTNLLLSFDLNHFVSWHTSRRFNITAFRWL